jgi:membrane protease YdiL (CAAX protease family)
MGAGFLEEAFYRGFLFRLFRQNHSFITAAVLSGLFWSFAHLTGCFSLSLSTITIDFAVHLIAIFIASIPAALLFERGGNVIWGFMATHLGWDLMVTSFPGNAQNTDMDIRHTGQFYLYAAFIASGLVTWALSSRLLRRNTSGPNMAPLEK